MEFPPRNKEVGGWKEANKREKSGKAIHRGLQGDTKGYMGLQGVTRSDRGRQGVTGDYKGL